MKIKQLGIILGLTLLGGVIRAESTTAFEYETVCDTSVAGLNAKVNAVLGRNASLSKLVPCWRVLGQVVIAPYSSVPGNSTVRSLMYCQTLVKVCSK
jgi:hypothetical protein